MPKVEPAVLAWARTTAGLSEEEAAEVLLKPARGLSPVERLRRLEAGTNEPSRALLKKMANRYRRPLLALYLPSPPARGERGEDFRTMPHPDALTDGRLDALIREVRVRHSILLSALEDEEELDPLPFVGSMKLSDGVPKVRESIRTTLGLDIVEFRRGSYDDAFRYLRNATESIGVFVLLKGNLGSFHSDISETVFRGFVLADRCAPFIVINDNDAKPALSFTLLHELAHIWLGETGVSDYSVDQKIERFCSEVAASLLVKASELAALDGVASLTLQKRVDSIQQFARAKNVSGAMVTYLLIRTKKLPPTEWGPVTTELRNRWHASERDRRLKEKARGSKKGPNYYVLRRYSAGNRLLGYARRFVRTETLSTSKAGALLGVKPTQVSSVLEEASL